MPFFYRGLCISDCAPHKLTRMLCVNNGLEILTLILEGALIFTCVGCAGRKMLETENDPSEEGCSVWHGDEGEGERDREGGGVNNGPRKCSSLYSGWHCERVYCVLK